MIALVEGAKRQKTPNEIALDILLAALTLVFLLATRHAAAVLASTRVGAAGQGALVTVTVLVALLVCLIPTTIGGLLSAIGIAGMDRMMQRQRDRHVAAARSRPPATSTCCCSTRPARSRSATARRPRFIPAPGVTERELADAAQLASLADETPEGRSIVVLAKEQLRPARARPARARRAPSSPSPRRRG